MAVDSKSDITVSVFVSPSRQTKLQQPRDLYTQCLKNTCHFYFYDNFGKCGPVFTIFTVKFGNDLRKRKN